MAYTKSSAWQADRGAGVDNRTDILGYTATADACSHKDIGCALHHTPGTTARTGACNPAEQAGSSMRMDAPAQNTVDETKVMVQGGLGTTGSMQPS